MILGGEDMVVKDVWSRLVGVGCSEVFVWYMGAASFFRHAIGKLEIGMWRSHHVIGQTQQGLALGPRPLHTVTSYLWEAASAIKKACWYIIYVFVRTSSTMNVMSTHISQYWEAFPTCQYCSSIPSFCTDSNFPATDKLWLVSECVS